jgi:RNA polymerase sigma-70 factor (ECF subfamily)
MTDEKISQALLKNRNSLMAFIFALTRDYEVAEDVFQETALAILREQEKGGEISNFMAWSREIARRRVLEYYRKRSKNRCLPLEEGMIDQIALAFEESEAERENDGERLRYLRECLAGLRREAAELIEMKYGKGLSLKQLSEKTGATVSALKVSLWRARQALARCIGRKLEGRQP